MSIIKKITGKIVNHNSSFIGNLTFDNKILSIEKSLSDKFDTIIAPQAWSSWRHSWPLSNKMQDYRFNKNMNNNSSLSG